ncbi:MAG: hypothetical protein AB8H80_23985 [Planctomycetota bacterium]
MSDSKLPVDPKELIPVAIGFVLGFGLLAFFIALAFGLDLTLLVDSNDIPRQ